MSAPRFQPAGRRCENGRQARQASQGGTTSLGINGLGDSQARNEGVVALRSADTNQVIAQLREMDALRLVIEGPVTLAILRVVSTGYTRRSAR